MFKETDVQRVNWIGSVRVYKLNSLYKNKVDKSIYTYIVKKKLEQI